MTLRLRQLLFLSVPLLPCGSLAQTEAETSWLHRFQRVELTDRYYSEGISAGDIDGDGAIDIVHGPFWFAGPEFTQREVIYKGLPQPREGYANQFFSWTYDFDGDGHLDILSVGFPGTPAYVYQHPGTENAVAPEGEWVRHEVFDWVSNESPHFTQLVGDERPELVCTREGYFGYASVDWDQPWAAWTFHKISPQVAPERFGHGLGVGDLNGDGRLDMLMKTGWWEQPENLEGDPEWAFHEVAFAPTGGAEMLVYDVDGDGDHDVITSLAAHAYGLSWWEQDEEGFREHLIMGDQPTQNRYGVVFSELHSVQLADVDGDGLKDIVTGKTYWSHHRQAPGWDDGAVVYWFQLVRGPDGVDWVPRLADGEAGIGRQIVVRDVNADGWADILVGGMKGAHVLLQRREAVTPEKWREEQPARIEGYRVPTDAEGM